MKENATPAGANALLVAAMSKEEIMDGLVQAYADAKPINDAMVDAGLRVQALTAEIYRRSIAKQLPGVPVNRLRTVMRVECSVHPNKGLPEIARRLAHLNEQGVEVISVGYDENTAAFSFYAAPEFDVKTPIPSPS